MATVRLGYGCELNLWILDHPSPLLRVCIVLQHVGPRSSSLFNPFLCNWRCFVPGCCLPVCRYRNGSKYNFRRPRLRLDVFQGLFRRLPLESSVLMLIVVDGEPQSDALVWKYYGMKPPPPSTIGREGAGKR